MLMLLRDLSISAMMSTTMVCVCINRINIEYFALLVLCMS